MSDFAGLIMSPRAWASAIASSVLSLAWLLAALAVTLALDSPLSAPSDLLAALTSLSSLAFIAFFTSLVLWSTLHHSTMFSTTPSVLKSWASLIHQVGTDPHKLASVVASSLVSATLAWCFLKIGPNQYSSLFATCPKDSQASFCFSEHHLFLLASALLSGITTGINYNFFSENYVAFPIIYKEKSSQIKEKLVPILQNSVLKGLRVSKMFYPMYIATCLLLRSNPTSLIMDCFNLHLFCMLLIITTLLFTVNSTMLTIFGIAACEPLDLNLEEAVAGLDKKGTTPLQRLLSLQQLAHLTGQEKSARASVFVLSQPGGHPHMWNSVRVACLDAINDISSSITAAISPKSAPPPPAPVPVVATLSTPMRRLAPTLPPKVEELTPATSTAPSNLHSLVTARMEALKTRPLLSALFHSTADHGVRSVLCRAQAAIWAIDVITNIVAASVAEDRFGIVQKDLPGVLGALLTLEQTLVKTRSLSLGTSQSQPDLLLRQELRQTIKSGLYKVAISFGPHILEVPVASQFKGKISSYHKFLEA